MQKTLVLTLCMTLFLASLNMCQRTISVGGLFPLSGGLVGGADREAAARFAVEEINNSTLLLPGILINFTTADTAVTPSVATINVIRLIQDYQAKVIIGAASSSVSQVVSVVTQAFEIPLISYLFFLGSAQQQEHLSKLSQSHS